MEDVLLVLVAILLLVLIYGLIHRQTHGSKWEEWRREWGGKDDRRDSE